MTDGHHLLIFSLLLASNTVVAEKLISFKCNGPTIHEITINVEASSGTTHPATVFFSGPLPNRQTGVFWDLDTYSEVYFGGMGNTSLIQIEAGPTGRSFLKTNMTFEDKDKGWDAQFSCMKQKRDT